MKKFILLFAFYLSFFTFCFAQQPIHLLYQKDEYTIVVPEHFTEHEIQAASELQHYLKLIFDCPFNIMTDNVYHGKNAISIGNNKLSKNLYAQYTGQIHNDGFLLHTDGENLYIIGNKDKSELYGVYHLLENYLDCAMIAPDDIHYPTSMEDAALNIHDLQNPSFAYREVLSKFPNQSQTYADWRKLQNREDMQNNWGYFVHSFQNLIPADNYFEAHPEWFSEINGQRIKDGQLCLSNPKLIDEVCANLKTAIKASPNKQIWSVSQNDNENSCTCAQCRHLDSLYGGPSGTMIYFINQVAARFPDKTISTLAYQQTRRPPKNIKPADNVLIMFCSIECQRQLPIAENKAEQDFVKDLEGWTALTHHIFLWDYVVQFRNYMDPFPNLHVIQPNLKLFYQHHINMMFEQGSGTHVTENDAWRTYLISNLMWNVNLNVDSLRDHFLNLYYGENRAPFIKQYMDTMTQTLLQSKQLLSIYGFPTDAKKGYLSPEKIKYYQSLFAKAYAVLPFDYLNFEGGADLYNDRLRLLELPLEFAILDLSLTNLAPELSFFSYENGKKVLNQAQMVRAEKFTEDCKRLGVDLLNENRYTPPQYLEDIRNYVDKCIQPNKAAGKHVTCLTRWSEKYDAGGPQALTDGVCGTLNYNFNWLGFEGENLDAIIDLDSVQNINEISMDFYYCPLSWIFAPVKVTYYVSDDQVKWHQAGYMTYQNEVNLLESKIVKMKIDNLHQRGRFVRVQAQSLLTNPEWHRGFGQPCWIFTDEIVIR